MANIEIPLTDGYAPEVENAKVELIIERGEARNRVREVTGPLFLIGANEDADLVLGDPQFSEYHAYICVRGDDVTLRHLGNSPEVTVNGRIIRWGELRDGDRLRMGPYQFRLAISPVGQAPAVKQPAVPREEEKRWSAHQGSVNAMPPKSDAWKKSTTTAQVVGWFDQVAGS
ncbi:MAG: FHA domain-containing protein [Planctomycetota bacterium]